MMIFQSAISKMILNSILAMTSWPFHLFIQIQLLLNGHFQIGYLISHHFAFLKTRSILICLNCLTDFFYLIIIIIFSLMIFMRAIMKMPRFLFSFFFIVMSSRIFYSLFSLFAFANDVNVFAFASAVKSVQLFNTRIRQWWRYG